MNLQRWLQLFTALLAVLGGSFLVLTGDQSPFPYALGGSALLALVLTDWLGWIKVPRGVGNVAALLSVAWTFREFTRLSRDREAQLLAISHMLIYLQVVLVFQAKTRRVHWQLLVLSVLQVVVAAALSLGPQFGLLLTVYMATAIGCMLLLAYHREVVEENVHPGGPAKSPLSLQRLLDPPTQRPSERRQVQLERWIGGTWLARSVLMFTLGTVAFAIVFFFTAPRLSEAVWQAGRGRTGVSGYSGEVALKSRGTVKLNAQPVMRVTFLRGENRRGMSLATEPYFHGQVLTNYARDDSGARWSFQTSIRLQRNMLRFHAIEETHPEDLVRQQVVLEAANSSVLFAMMPVKILPETPTIIREARVAPKLTRRGQEDQLNLGQEFRYTLGTLAIRNGRQLPAIPHYNPAETQPEKHLLLIERQDLQHFSAEQFPGIKSVADEVIAEADLHGAPTLERALALRNFLFGSGKFRYSLDFDDELTAEQAALDPLELFLVHRRRGHCEFFASALVMMLRSQNIPARMVVGYKGGDWNSVGHYYLVRQKHAHAWVEVLLAPDEVPAEEIAGKPSGGGAWYRLDPTPAAEATPETEAAQVADIFDYADYLWRDYVVGLNAGRQDEVLDPLTGDSREWLTSVLPVGMWQRQLGLAAVAKPSPPDAAQQSVDGRNGMGRALQLLLLIVAPAAVAGLLIAILRFGRWSLRWGTQAPQTSPLFQRWSTVLERSGVRIRGQATSREIVQLAENKLRLTATPGRLSAILQTIVAGYHRLRFGGCSLSTQEQATMDEALRELRQAQPVAESSVPNAHAGKPSHG